jgi:xanthine dehydrogenase accessory factor
MQSSDREVLQTAVMWLQAGHSVELITLAAAWGSAQRPVGSLAIVREDGMLSGSISGGCIEKQLSIMLRKDDGPKVVQHEVSRDQAVRFGLPCGGTMHLVFEKLLNPEPLQEIISHLDKRQRVRRRIDLETNTATIEPASREEKFYFDGKSLIKVFGPAWRVLLIGAGELSRYVAEIAMSLEYEVIVCEPRKDLHPAWQIPGVQIDTRSPDDVVVDLSSDRRSAVLALTHDPNLDDLAVMEALPSDVFYVGALGSRKNNDLRRKRLVALDLEPNQIARLHGPIGLPIGSQTPAEIAVSIMAEVTAVRNNITLSVQTEKSVVSG